jgi:hypothetical protein
MEMNKRGQGLSTNAIILIILGIVILVVLIVGFAMGWDRIAPWLSRENVDEVVNGCNVACNTQAEYAFCSQPRELVDAEKNEYKDITCHALSTLDETEKYGIEECDLDCEAFTFIGTSTKETACEGQTGVVGYFEVSGRAKTFDTIDCAATTQ